MHRVIAALSTLACVLPTALAAPPAAAPPVPGVSQSFKIDLDPAVLAAEGQPLLIDRDEVARAGRNGRHVFAGFPLSLVDRVDLDVERIDPPGRNARNVIVTEAGEIEVPTPEIDLFRGRVVGEPDSEVFLSLGACGVNGWITRGGRSWSVSSGSAKEPHPPAIFATDTPTFREMAWTEFSCSVRTPPARERDEELPPPPVAGLGGACRTLEIALDTDNQYRWRFNSNLEALTYLHVLIAAVDQIYRDEVNLQFDVVFTRLWNVTDPWTGTTREDALDEFESHWDSLMDNVHRDLAHQVCGRDLGGGVAYLNALCDYDDVTWTISYGVSGNISGSFPTPLRDRHEANGDVVIVAHEIGHNCGATHTHELDPPDDECGNGNCAHAPGSIMSYCQQCDGGWANIELKFSQRNREQILSYVDGMDCLPFSYCQSEPMCVLAVDPVASEFGGAGGSGRVDVDVVALGCMWVPENLPSWITIDNPDHAETYGFLAFTVAPNPGSAARSATLQLGAKTHVVTQCGQACTYQVTPEVLVFGHASGNLTRHFDLIASCDLCDWTASSTESWISPTDPSGTGSGPSAISVDPNYSPEGRIGTVAIGDATILIYQQGVPWSPAAVPSLQAWFDAAAPGAVVPTAGPVSNWADRATDPIRWATATGTARPLYVSNALDGKPVLRFDGVNDGLAIGTTPLLKSVNGASIFAMRRFAAVPSAVRNVAFVATGTNVRNPRLALRGSATGKPEAVARRLDGNPSVLATAATGVPPLSPYQVHGAIADFTAGRLTQFVNGLPDGSATLPTGVTSATDSKGLGIGRSATAAAYFAGDIGEIAIFGSALSLRDRFRLEGYLAHHWGLEATLPESHPHRTAPPGQVVECACAGSFVVGERVVRSAFTTVSGPPVGSTGLVVGGSSDNPMLFVAWDGFGGSTGGTTVDCPMLATAPGNGSWLTCDEILPSGGPACAYALSTPSPYLASTSGTLTLSITTGEAGCPWTAGSSAAWLVPSLGSTSGVGPDTLTFTYTANPLPAPRTATVNAGGQTFTVLQVGSGSLVWTPDDLAGLEAWYLADAIPAGDRPLNVVSRWIDMANDFDVTATDVQRPLFVANGFAGKPVVRFDGVQDGLARGTSTLMRNANGGAIFAVRKHAAVPAAARAIAFLSTGTSTANARFQLRGASTGKPDAGVRRLDSSSVVTATGPSVVTTSMQVHGAVANFGLGSLTQWVNGAAAGSAGLSFGVSSNTDALGFAIGRATNLTQYFQGDLGEVVVVRGALGTDDRQRLEGYLAHRWGLQASLPTAHPYRNAPPTNAPSCTYALSAPTASVGAAAGSGSVAVTASDASCGWTATSDAAWLVPGAASGTGSATLAYSFTANASPSSRTGTITVAGQTHAVTQAGVPVVVWTPAVLPGIQAWFKADEIAAADRVDGLVARWTDAAGTFHVTATGTKRPQWIANAQAGKAVVRFDGTDDGLALGASGMLRDAEASIVFAVRRHATVPTAARTSVYVSTGTATNAARIVLRTTAAGLPELGARRLDADTTAITSASPAVATAFQLHGAIADFVGGKLAQWIDGVPSSNVPVSTGRTSDTNSVGFALGRAVNNTSFLSGDLAEVVVVRTMLSDCDRKKLEGYLAHRWGIAANLPVGHPFRLAPPNVSDPCGSALAGDAEAGGPVVTVPGMFPSLQAAIDASPDGATIVLAAGVHAGGAVVSGKSLAIVSESGPAATVIDGEGQVGSVLRIEDGADVGLRGLTIRGGFGGTPVERDGDTLLAGGGVLVRDATAEIVGCVIEENLAGFGGGIAAVDATLVVDSCDIRLNHAAHDGGGLWSAASAGRLLGGAVRGNAAGGAGGGVAIDETSTLEVAGTEFCDNEPDHAAGPIEGEASRCGACAADLDGDGLVAAGDLAMMFAAWGEGDLAADLDGDGAVSAADLATLLEAWDANCPR